MNKVLTLVLVGCICALAVKSQSGTPNTLRHVVLIKFKETASAANIKAVEDAFGQLQSKIDVIKNFEWGTNNSPEKLNEGLTHCFFVTFGTEKGRDEYLVHPAHQAFVEVLKPVLDKVVVMDYWVKN